MYKVISRLFDKEKEAEQFSKKIRPKLPHAEVGKSNMGFPVVVFGQFKLRQEAEEYLSKIYTKVDCFIIESTY